MKTRRTVATAIFVTMGLVLSSCGVDPSHLTTPTTIPQSAVHFADAAFATSTAHPHADHITAMLTTPTMEHKSKKKSTSSTTSTIAGKTEKASTQSTPSTSVPSTTATKKNTDTTATTTATASTTTTTAETTTTTVVTPESTTTTAVMTAEEKAIATGMQEIEIPSTDSSTQSSVSIPSDFCAMLSLGDCSSITAPEVKVRSKTSFQVTAEIPNSSISLPSNDVASFSIGNTKIRIDVDGDVYEYTVFAPVTLKLPGLSITLDFVGTFITSSRQLSIELTNKAANWKDAMSIPGFDIDSITGKTTMRLGSLPEGIAFAMTGKVPTFLQEIGINPNTKFRIAGQFGLGGMTLGLMLGSQAKGAENIFEINKVLSATYLAFSFASSDTLIDGIVYPQGYFIAFDGEIAETPVIGKGLVTPSPEGWEYDTSFSIGAFSLGGFSFEDSIGWFKKNSDGVKVGFIGGLSGYGIVARLNGEFDATGGIQLVGEGTFAPAGINFASMKFTMNANAKGFEFTGTAPQRFGVFSGTATVGLKSFPNAELGYNFGMNTGLALPGFPDYASVSGSIGISNCPDMACTNPDALPSATLTGSASFYGQPDQSFAIAVNPNDWSFKETLSFNYDEELGYSSNGFWVGARATGNGSITISDKGISLGKGSMGASAGFSTPDVNVPEVTLPVVETRLPKTTTTCDYWPGTKVVKKCTTKTEYYTSRTGGQVFTPAYTIPGIKIVLSAEVGIDDRGFYIQVFGKSGTDDGRLYFK